MSGGMRHARTRLLIISLVLLSSSVEAAELRSLVDLPRSMPAVKRASDIVNAGVERLFWTSSR